LRSTSFDGLAETFIVNNEEMMIRLTEKSWRVFDLIWRMLERIGMMLECRVVERDN
jgi:hypothetical protein